jgi:carboxyl-terminal processing protease
VVVGERTYGKGLVQQTRDLRYNSKVKVTVAKYYIPSGRCIQKLDYAHRDSAGKVTEVKEDAIAEFKTLNGRPVFDGRGILPDVDVVDPELARVVGGLFQSDVFFDLATDFRAKHPTIATPEEFRISDEIFADLVAMAKERKLEYSTQSMEALTALEDKAKKERYYEHTKESFEALRRDLAPHPEEDMERFRADIEELLRSEIVSRYYFQTGRAKAAMGTDPYIAKAVEVLNSEQYSTILAGKGGK